MLNKIVTTISLFLISANASAHGSQFICNEQYADIFSRLAPLYGEDNVQRIPRSSVIANNGYFYICPKNFVSNKSRRRCVEKGMHLTPNVVAGTDSRKHFSVIRKVPGCDFYLAIDKNVKPRNAKD